MMHPTDPRTTMRYERVPAPGMTLYTMTKAALTGLTKGLAWSRRPAAIPDLVLRWPCHLDRSAT